MRCIVLVGIGHTNAYVVRKWIDSPLPDCRLVCISNSPITTYSGMLPGVLAGQFTRAEMQIDLPSLCERAGAELIIAQVDGLDAPNSLLTFADRESLPFDALSLGVGSMPVGWKDIDTPALVPIKPMSSFLDRLDSRIKVASHRVEQTGRPLKFVVVGGGVASIEIALCLRARLESTACLATAPIQLVTSSREIAEELRPSSIQRLRQTLERRRITVTTDVRITGAVDESLVDEHGRQTQADCVIWTTGAAPPPLLAKIGLPTDSRGFIATDSTLRTIADQPIFAVGDCGTILDCPAPKAGVYAVRQAPILWHNLRAVLDKTPMHTFQPQRDFLKLLNTGDGKALMQYKSFTFYGRWCWWLKTFIDKRFITAYQSSERPSTH